MITDLGVLEPDPVTRELTMTGVCPGVTIDRVRSRTGWDLAVAADLHTVAAPTAAELAALHALQAMTPRS